MIVVLIFVAIAAIAFVGWLRLKRHGESATAHASWHRTDEVFRDPSSGRIMRVWHDPADGSRHYVPEASSGPRGS